MLTLDSSYLSSVVSQGEREALESALRAAYDTLLERKGQGKEFTDWLDLPASKAGQEFQDIKNLAQEIRKEADHLVSVGIGGSYLGAKAVIEALTPAFSPDRNRVLFAGFTLSPAYHRDLLEHLKDKSYYVNMISKSGTTTEPAIAFRLLRKQMAEQEGEDEGAKDRLARRIIATTDPQGGTLRKMAPGMGWRTLVVPPGVGGRYSVLTAAGLLPIAVAGVDIDALMDGAQAMADRLKTSFSAQEACLQYAALRYLLYLKSYRMEIFAFYEPQLAYLGEWLKQLFGESEGKDGRGLFPGSVTFTTDLHSLGQFIQEGTRNLFFLTHLMVGDRPSLPVPEVAGAEDGLDYLLGKEMSEVNLQAKRGTEKAHFDGRTPSMTLEIPKMDAYHMGAFVYFFEFACAVSAYLLQVNPFNQPGVEFYKKNMFELLGKPKN